MKPLHTTHPHPLPKGGGLPTISPKGRVKHH